MYSNILSMCVYMNACIYEYVCVFMYVQYDVL